MHQHAAFQLRDLGDITREKRELIELRADGSLETAGGEGTEGGVDEEDDDEPRVYRKTPYQLAIDCGMPAYYRRLLLRAAPHLDPAELRRLNWEERRLAMYVATAVAAKKPVTAAAKEVAAAAQPEGNKKKWYVLLCFAMCVLLGFVTSCASVSTVRYYLWLA